MTDALVVDERLREREFGILDRLTRRGIIEQHPEQAELRAHLGKASASSSSAIRSSS